MKARIKAAYRAAFDFHSEALQKLPAMEPGMFWEWAASRVQEVSNTNGDNELLQALLIAAYEDLERIAGTINNSDEIGA